MAEYESSASSDEGDVHDGAPRSAAKATVLDARQLVEASRRKRLYVAFSLVLRSDFVSLLLRCFARPWVHGRRCCARHEP